jgi:Tol biopolymer transport system component
MEVRVDAVSRIGSAATGMTRRLACLGGITALVIVGCGGEAASPIPTVTQTDSPHAAPTPSKGLAEHGRIAFTLESGTTGALSAHILSIEPNGTHLMRLTTAAGFDDDPAWTPAGDRILFDRTFPPGANDENATSKNLFSMEANGGSVRQLTSERKDVFDAGPAMSPDGTRIAFERFDLSGRETGIYLMNTDGSSVRRITTTPASAAGGDHDASFSPDGTTIAFVRDGIDGGQGVIYVVGIDSKGLRQVTQTSIDVTRPRWSPDGSKLLFAPSETNQAPSGRDVYVANSDGTGLTALTHESGKDSAGDPDWSPDGTMIVFNQFQDGTGYIALSVMHADGSDPIVIWHPTSNTNDFPVNPAWGTAP